MDKRNPVRDMLRCANWIFCCLPLASSLLMDEMANQIQGVDVICDPAEIRLNVRTALPYFGRIYPKGLGKSVCEKVYQTNVSNASPNETLTIFSVPLTSCNTFLHEIPTGLEYQNTIVIQVHRALVTQGDRVYNIRCRYESVNTTIMAVLNMSDSVPAMQLEARAALPVVSMSLYKGTSESRVMADRVMIGDPVALVVNLASQNIYGMIIRDCFVKDGVDMGGVQPLIDSKGCPVDSTIFGGFIYSADLTQAYVIFRAHKFPYAETLYYECSVKFCLKVGGDCQKTPAPPVCDRARQKRSIRTTSRNENSDKTVAVVRGMTVREPSDLPPLPDAELLGSDDLAIPVKSPGQLCIPRSAFAVILAVAAFLILLSVTILVAVVLDKRKRRTKKGQNASDTYSSVYISHYGGDKTRTSR